ncbi:MAG: SLC13 family permease, partial [Acidimicrobiia bacterium]
HRSGQRLSGKLGDIRLRVGDTLLLLADPGFGDRWRDRRDFLLVSRLGRIQQPPSPRAAVVGLVAVGIVASAASGAAPLVTSAVVGATVLVLLRIVTPGEARDAVDIDVIVTIAAAFGLAAAMINSGLADDIAGTVVDSLGRWGDTGILLGIVLATVVIKELITNKAAILIIMPIALSSSTALDLDPRGMAVAIAVAAGASFLTPIGAPTNTMVYGPGGYRFTDYLRLGLPLTAVTILAVMILVPAFWPL